MYTQVLQTYGPTTTLLPVWPHNQHSLPYNQNPWPHYKKHGPTIKYMVLVLNNHGPPYYCQKFVASYVYTCR